MIWAVLAVMVLRVLLELIMWNLWTMAATLILAALFAPVLLWIFIPFFGGIILYALIVHRDEIFAEEEADEEDFLRPNPLIREMAEAALAFEEAKVTPGADVEAAFARFGRALEAGGGFAPA